MNDWAVVVCVGSRLTRSEGRVCVVSFGYLSAGRWNAKIQYVFGTCKSGLGQVARSFLTNLHELAGG